MTADLLLARLPLTTRRVAKQPTSVAELPPELVAAAINPAVFEHGLPFIETAVASTDLIDTYGTWMRPSSLKNYAADATAGISVQNSHKTNELPLGRTYAGRYAVGPPGRTEMDFFIPRRLNVNGINSDDVIRAIGWGTVRDVSIGFFGGTLMCSLCGKPMLSSGLAALMGFGPDAEDKDVLDPSLPCSHIPGQEYARRDVKGKKTTKREIAVGEVEGAHCAELSLVFDGATPQAQIGGRMAPALAKARALEALDLLPRGPAAALEQR